MGSFPSKDESCINYISNRNDSSIIIDIIKYQVKVKKFLKIIENNWNRYKQNIYKTVLTKDIFLEKLRDNLLDKNTRESSIKEDINFIINEINEKTKTFFKNIEKFTQESNEYNENNPNNVDLLNLLFIFY